MSIFGLEKVVTIHIRNINTIFTPKHLKKSDRNKDADVEDGLEDMGRGKGKLGQSERVALTYIRYQM